jgi:hypothetical protein
MISVAALEEATLTPGYSYEAVERARTIDEPLGCIK